MVGQHALAVAGLALAAPVVARAPDCGGPVAVCAAPVDGGVALILDVTALLRSSRQLTDDTVVL